MKSNQNRITIKIKIKSGLQSAGFNFKAKLFTENKIFNIYNQDGNNYKINIVMLIVDVGRYAWRIFSQPNLEK